MCPQVGQLFPGRNKFDQFRADAGQSWGNFSQIWPDIAQVWGDFGRILAEFTSTRTLWEEIANFEGRGSLKLCVASLTPFLVQISALGSASSRASERPSLRARGLVSASHSQTLLGAFPKSAPGTPLPRNVGHKQNDRGPCGCQHLLQKSSGPAPAQFKPDARPLVDHMGAKS